MKQFGLLRRALIVVLLGMVASFSQAVNINDPGIIYRIVCQSNGQAVTNGNQSAHTTRTSRPVPLISRPRDKTG